ncbi:hypothetical protein MKX07_003202 [Trichoderma sp. CBMAI-0711]|nr:hypothetical protein MKX07_003202 [Trichoderma sp. CBMAI-0711]
MDEESITALPPNDTVESHANASETVQLDPEGDAVLSIKGSGGNKSYLVSSRVLSLASPVFSKMFSPNFKEGIQTRRGDRPCISLGEDDPKAIGLILSILHYNCSQVPFDLEPAALAAIAVHCDKYGCNEALKPWAAHWCSKLEDVTAPEDLGFMLLAAYLFRSPSFSEVAAKAVRQLTPDFASVWAEHEMSAMALYRALHHDVLSRISCIDSIAP